MVNHFASAVVSLSGIPFGVFVGQHTAHSLHDLVAHEVFGGNQLNAFQLALPFLLDNIKNNGVSLHKYLINFVYSFNCIVNHHLSGNAPKLRRCVQSAYSAASGFCCRASFSCRYFFVSMP
ncbi:hypothetical protein Barb7_02685 [Bacteroidales bacterium Barb7]|nr:hypothetical protein Barb7_02685 [Bacteroidales bacterium Barb7]